MKMCLDISCLLLLAVFLLSGCDPAGNSENEFTGGANPDSAYRGLAFTGVDPDFISSDGYFYDFTSGTVRKIAWGQGGDPKLIWLEDTLYFFNRRDDQRNFFPLEITGQGSGVKGAKSFSSGADGTPQRVIRLTNGNLLLTEMAAASPVGGRVFQINPSDGSRTGENLVFLVPGGHAFHPSDILVQDISGERILFISHKGLQITTHPSFASIANGSQAVFAVKDTPEGPEVLNGGHPVAIPAASDPVFTGRDSGRLLVGGFCYGPASEGDCVQSFETFEPAAARNAGNALSGRVDFALNKISFLGGLAQGFATGEFYAAVNHLSGSSREKIIAKFTLDQVGGTYGMIKVHEFPESYFGGYMFITDPSSKMLYFGEADSGREHYFLQCLHESGTLNSVALDRIPYSGDFVR